MNFKSIALSLVFLSSSAPAWSAGFLPQTVSDVDLNSYLGRWYEIESTHPSFQKDCVCVTADYSLAEDGNVEVVNTCRKSTPEGELSQALGRAEATSNPAKFNVSFGGFQLPISNYWIVDLASDYSYAVVSTPIRTPVWILSRTPELPEETLAAIKSKLKDDFFWTSRITPTRQESCTYESPASPQ